MANDDTKMNRPWWAPDAQGFLAFAIVFMTFTALLVRMFSPSNVDDKMLDTMITILFSTCLVTVYQFTFGSSRGSERKDETQSRMLEKLPPPNGTGGGGPPAPAPAPTVIAAATAAAVEAVKVAAPAAAAEAAPPAAATAAPPAAEIAVEAALDERGIPKPKDTP